VLRSGTASVDLALLTLSEPAIKGLRQLGCARVDQAYVGWIDNCVAVGFPRWRKDGDRRRSAQVDGRVLTAEGLEASGDSGLHPQYLTFVVDRIPGGPQIPLGTLTEAPSASPWGGMSGAGVVAGDFVIGVIRSHNLAAGGQSLTVTPLTAIDGLPYEQRERFWSALGVVEPSVMPTVAATEIDRAQAGNSSSLDASDESPAIVGTARLIVPAITDDAVEGHPDRLGVDADARALAALVASGRLEPPLAIGLYGEWGSGKTFFMKRVQSSVEDLATSGATDAFCSRIAPVWFSAWHYAQGNLWASLLHHVFASLHPANSKHQLALDEVMAKVQGAQQVTSALAAQTEAATMRLNGANEAIDAAKERHQKALQESSKLRGKDLWDAVKLSAADQHLKDQVIKAADDLGITVATGSAQDLVAAARQVVELASRTRILAISKPWYRSPLAYALYAAVIVGSLGLLLGTVVRTAHEWAGTAITAIAQLAAVGSAAAAWIIRQGGLARRIISPAETLQGRLEQRLAEQQARNEQELAALQQESDTARTELAVAIQQRAVAEHELAAAEKEQTELTGKRLLSRYLAERASSGDYEHYMGLVALAHRDLRDLEEYLRAAIDDVDSKEEGLDRIVLYIDDLDRCDPDTVADVLDAVHLLLALRLFVVIVGVDPRWLKRSLRERHPILLESTPSDITWTSPTDYLEKIFQLTYTLPHMSSISCAELLVAAAQDAQITSARQDEQRTELTTEDADRGTGGSSFDNGNENDADKRSEDNGQLSHTSDEYLAEALTLSADDIDALRSVAPLVSISPRRAKRFLNIYLVIRARALGDPATRKRLSRNGDAAAPAPDNSLLMLVALLMGLPRTMAAFIHGVPQSENGNPITLATSLTKVATAPDEQARLRAFLNSRPSIATLPMDAFMRWLPLARPFLPLDFKEPQDSGPVS
jgi:hypothetical protein